MTDRAESSSCPGRIEVTRLAPSPTGALHLGNLRTFLINWAMARQRGWRIVFRMEDLDGPRVKPWAEDSVFRILSWIGLDWDDEPVRQSDDLMPYREAMQELARHHLIYPCRLTRREIAEAASAPHRGDHETRCPTALRPVDRPGSFNDELTNWRFVTGAEEIAFNDEFRGPVRVSPAESVGDFVLWTKRGQPSYQLAVVVDDARQGVTRVVRGDDLLDSVGRQLLLYRGLGLSPEPVYCHLPLVVGEDGRRLAKRHGDTRIEFYRAHGVPHERVIGLIAWWSGMSAARQPVSLEEFLGSFDLATLPRSPVVFEPDDHAWLLEGTVP